MKLSKTYIFLLLQVLVWAMPLHAQIYQTSRATMHYVGSGAVAPSQGTSFSTSSRRASSTSSSAGSYGGSAISISHYTSPNVTTTTETVSPADYQMASTSSASMSPSRYATAGASSSSTGVLETIASSIIPGTTTEDYTDYSPAQVQARTRGGGGAPPTVAPLDDTWDVIVLLCLALGALAIYRKRINLINKNDESKS